MATTIKCKQCGNIIEITEAIRKELEEKVLQETQALHQAEIVKIQQENAQLLEQSKEQIKQKAISEAQKAYEAKIKITKDEAEEQEKRNHALQQELSEVMKSLRAAKDAESRLKIDFEKKLLAEQDAIKQQAKKEAEEEQNLKIAERDKKIADAQKQIQELQRKIEQGSQQTQGEVQELQLEESLKQLFVFDVIKEVPKGIKGADIIQEVRSRNGMVCGQIVWESKNTKNWSTGWIAKLKEDQRALKAELAVIVSNILPPEIKSFACVEGIWICDLRSAYSLAQALRQQLLEVAKAKQANEGKASKAEYVYNYLTSNDFKQRIEVWVEYFRARQEEITKERIFFTKKWEKEEKNIFKIMESTAGIYGDLQGLIGNSLPKIEYLELPDVNDDDLSDSDSSDSQNSLPL